MFLILDFNGLINWITLYVSLVSTLSIFAAVVVHLFSVGLNKRFLTYWSASSLSSLTDLDKSKLDWRFMTNFLV